MTIPQRYILSACLIMLLLMAPLYAQTSEIVITSEPASATVYRDTVPLGETPLSIKIENDGWAKYQVFREGFIAQRESLLIAGPGSYKLDLHLVPCCELMLRSIPSKATIILDDSMMGFTDRVIRQVSLGAHMFRLSQRDCWDSICPVVFPETKRYDQTIRLRPRQTLLSVIGTPAGAMLKLNGGKVWGVIPLGKEGIDWGDYILTTSKTGYHQDRRLLAVHADAMAPLDIRLRRKSVPLACALSGMFPGAGQLYSGRRTAGYSYLLTGLAVDFVGVLLFADLNKKITQYEDSRVSYQGATDCREVIELREDMEKKHDAALVRSKQARSLIVTGCLLRLLSALEAVLFFPGK